MRREGREMIGLKKERKKKEKIKKSKTVVFFLTKFVFLVLRLK